MDAPRTPDNRLDPRAGTPPVDPSRTHFPEPEPEPEPDKGDDA